MSKNVVLWDGTVVTVSDEQAAQLQSGNRGRQEDTSEANATGASNALENNVSGIDKAQAFVEGGLDTLSGGLYGKAVQYLGDDEARFAMQRSAAVAPGYRVAGELGAALLPSGLLGRGAKAVGEASALGGAARAGRALEAATGSRALGRLGEGAILGVGGTVAHTNVTGDPLSVEGLIEGAGVGGVLNVGVGVLADKLHGAGQNAKKAILEAEELSRATEVAKTNAKHFDSDAGVATAYKHFSEAVKVQEQAARQAEKQWLKQEKLYNSFAQNNKNLTSAIEDAENTVRSVRQRYSPHPPPGQTPEGQHPGFDTSDVADAPGRKGLDVEWIDGKPRAKHYKWDQKTGEEFTVLHDSKPPISDELHGRLTDYQQRVSRLYQMKGGRAKINAGGKWSPSAPSDAADPEAVMGELRSLYTDLQRDFPKAAAKLKPIPAPLSARPPAPHSIELAPTFKAFTRQRPETINRLVTGMDDTAAAEFERVTAELGVAPGATSKESILAVHNQAREWLSAMDAVEATAKQATEASGKGFFEIARRFVRNTIRFKAGFGVAHAVGGPLGSALGVATSAGVGAAIDTLDGAVVGGALVTAKTGVKDRISQVVAKYGGTTARGVRTLGPVSSYLSTSHLTGKNDDEKDLRRQARNRVDEIHGAVLTAPDAAFSAVEGLLGHPSDIAYKTSAFIMNAINHLAATAPRDPGLNIKMFKSNWTPAWHEAVAFANRLEAVHNPMSSLARLLSGSGHPAAAETLWTVWPAVMQYAAAEIVERASRGEFSTERASAFSRVFRVPLTGFQNPAMIVALQALHLPPPQMGAGGGAQRAPQPSGRPPAVQSPVAGSNVASLIS